MNHTKVGFLKIKSLELQFSPDISQIKVGKKHIVKLKPKMTATERQWTNKRSPFNCI
jgi:hypothetical protein